MALNIPGRLKTLRALVEKADRCGNDELVAELNTEIKDLEHQLRNPPQPVFQGYGDRPRYGGDRRW